MEKNLNNIAFTLYSNKGVFALILGSGISRSSGIPTGWDIVIDLIKKLAKLENENYDSSPEEWYRKKFGEEPDYSNILEKIASTPTERLNILKSYFENKEEIDLFQPTKAHKAIAKLVKKGYIKVIITTNFDRLIEKSLLAEGVEPLVIKHQSDIDGALPLVHSNFTLIKVNGDYLDTRFLNTKDELDDYSDNLKDYLLKVFNEFGIISSGWSAKWDNGLVNLIKQCENFRFSSYWSFVHKCNPELKELADLRKGHITQIEDADNFFNELLEKIEALETFDKEDPLSADIAIARIKKYLTKDENIVSFRDLLIDECKKAKNQIINAPKEKEPIKIEEFKHLLTSYLSSLEILIPMSIYATFWARDIHYEYLKEVILRLIKQPEIKGSFSQDSFDFNLIPALITFYSVGIAATKRKNYNFLNELFELKINNFYYPEAEKIQVIQKINSSLIEKEFFKNVANNNNSTPMSFFLRQELRPFFQDLIYDDNEYEQVFSLFEYLISLNYMHLVKDNIYAGYPPLGEYQKKLRYFHRGNNYLKDFIDDSNKEKNEWAPLLAGMFDSSYEVFLRVYEKLEEYRRQIHY